MFTILIQSSACMILFYGIYFAFLKKLTFFEFNRWFLLSSILLSIIIPVVGPYFTVVKPELFVYHLDAANIEMQLPEKPTMTLNEVFTLFLTWFYWVGVSITLLRFSIGLLKIARLYREGERTNKMGLSIVYSEKVHLPFSFLKTVFISKNLPMTEEMNQIILHEKVHISRLHTFDIILTELAHVFFWFNPVLVFYKRALKASHEYIADAVVTTYTDKKSYLNTLINHSVSGLQMELTNQFFHSQIKKRLEMMDTKSSKKQSLARYLLIVPLILVLGILFASAKLNDHIDKKPTEDFIAVKDSLPAQATYYINDVKSNLEEVQSLDKKDILSIDVVKPTSEMKNYEGEQHNGVVLIYTKTIQKLPADAVYFINEKQVTKEEALALDKSKIAMINVRGGENTLEQDGGKETVNIYTKDAKNIPHMPSPPPPPAPPAPPAPSVRLPPLPPQAPAAPLGPESRLAPTAPSVPLPPLPPLEQTMSKEYQGEKIYNVVDEMPVAKGCETGTKQQQSDCTRDKMMNKLFQVVKYPVAARNAGREGTAVVQFIITKDGKMTDFNLLRDPGFGIGDAGMDAIKELSKTLEFNPGMNDGKPVNVSYVMPVKFKIDVKATSSFEKEEPLYLVNGEIADKEEIGLLDPNNIESLNVLKGEKAIAAYGTKGKNGVIEIKTKIATSSRADTPVVVGYKSSPDLDFKIYPNPAKESVQIEFTPKGDEAITIEAFTLDGKSVEKNVIRGQKGILRHSLDLSKISGAQTLIVTVSQGKNISSQKVMVNN